MGLEENDVPTAMAIAAHPDDIEFMMAGTLFLLRNCGWDLHYWNLADGRCGSNEHDAEEIVAVREREARSASDLLGAAFHAPIRRDLEIFYESDLIRRICAVVREVSPDALLLQSPKDYMEDHITASRAAVTAAFARGMQNYPSIPPREPIEKDVAVYHAMPYGLRDELGRPVEPHFVVDIERSLDSKLEMLGSHRSQRRWLDVSQGLDSYLDSARDMSRTVAGRSARGKMAYAEGWRRHLELGFHRSGFDPIASALSDLVLEVAE